MSQRFSREEIKAHLTGPIASVRTLFRQDGSIDDDAMRNALDFVLAAGTKTVLLTFGDSLFTILTDREIADVTRLVAKHTDGRALVVAADRSRATEATIEFADYAREVGADVMMVMPPDWGASCTPRTFADHYAAVAKGMPVMLVTNVFGPRGTATALETLRIVREEAENVVAIKDDVCGEFARRMSLLVHGQWSVISGGQKQNHLDLLPYGCDAYLSTFLTFAPNVAHTYWDAVQANDLSRAAEIIRVYDLPFFDTALSMTGGFDAAIHGALELFGIAPRWRRLPYYSLNDAEMEQLRDFFHRLTLL